MPSNTLPGELIVSQPSVVFHNSLYMCGIVTFKVLVRAAALRKTKIIDQGLHKKLSTSLSFSRACLTLQPEERLCKSGQHVMMTQHVRRAWGWIKPDCMRSSGSDTRLWPAPAWAVTAD